MSKLHSMSIADLIETLREAGDAYGFETQVVVTADYGDICHTQQALPLTGRAELLDIEESGYSHSGWAISQDQEEEPEDDEMEDSGDPLDTDKVLVLM